MLQESGEGDDSSRSLYDRARAVARENPDGEVAQFLGVIGLHARVVAQSIVPAYWTVWRVMDRLEEAFETLSRIPVQRGPRGYSNSMPAYRRDIFDRNSQIIGQESDELERQARLKNRVRLGASAAQIGRMNEALAWPMIYLKGMPEVAHAVCLGAIWANGRGDVTKRAKARRMSKRTFIRRQFHGLNMIVAGLSRGKVQVR